MRDPVRRDIHRVDMHDTVSLRSASPHSTAAAALGRRLDAEWVHLRTSRRALQEARTWACPGDGLFDRTVRSVGDLDEVLLAARVGGPVGAGEDAVLIRLVEHARHHELAGRIVVQRLLPGLIAGSRRYRDHHSQPDPIDIVVAAAWIAIRRYDTAARTRHVAASLISDAVFQAFRQPLRRRAATEVPRSPDHFLRDAADERSHPFLELADVVRAARRAGVDEHHLELIGDLVRTGSPSITAAERQVTPRTVRNHRDRAVAGIRAVVAA